MSPKLNRQMKRVIEELEFRDDVAVLVLTGEGAAWSAGMDLLEYFRMNEDKGLGAIRQAQREAYGWWERLRWYEKPTIAMVNGWRSEERRVGKEGVSTWRSRWSP